MDFGGKDYSSLQMSARSRQKVRPHSSKQVVLTGLCQLGVGRGVMEAGGSGVQGYPWLCTKSEASLGYKKACLDKTK